MIVRTESTGRRLIHQHDRVSMHSHTTRKCLAAASPCTALARLCCMHPPLPVLSSKEPRMCCFATRARKKAAAVAVAAAGTLKGARLASTSHPSKLNRTLAD